MLTFNVVLGYQGILFQDFLWIFFRLIQLALSAVGFRFYFL